MDNYSQELVTQISRSITQSVFLSATPARTPEENLLDELNSRHCPNELYPIWRVAKLVRSLGCNLFVLGEDAIELKSKLAMDLAFSPGVAHHPTKAIVLNSWQICRLATDVARVRVCAAMTAIALHEASHLLSNTSGTTAQREVEAWAMARELLAVHQFYSICQEWEFDRVAEKCLESYGVRA